MGVLLLVIKKPMLDALLQPDALIVVGKGELAGGSRLIRELLTSLSFLSLM